MSIPPERHGVVHAACAHSVAALRHQCHDNEPHNRQKEGKRGRESGKKVGKSEASRARIRLRGAPQIHATWL